MMRNRKILRSASAAGLGLAAGRTPACWRSELTRQASQTGSLRRACDWVGPLAKVSARLLDKPLFGNCLAELVEAADAIDGDSARQTQPRRASKSLAAPTSTGKSNGPRRRQARTGGSAECSTEATGQDAVPPHRAPQVCAAEVTALPHRASRELLELCVEKQDLVNRRSPAAACDSSNAAKPRSHSFTQSKIEREDDAPLQRIAGRRKTEAISQLSKPYATRRDSFATVNGRNSNLVAYSASGPEEFAQRIARRAINKLRRLQPPPNGETQESGLLARQWSTTLDGTTAPAGLLKRIATGEQETVKAGERRQSPQAASQSPYAATRKPVKSPAIEERQTRSSPSDEQDQAPSPEPFDDLSSHARRNTADSRPGAERIAPPALAPSLPALSPLTPAPQPAASGVLPLASDLARQGAREEATPTEDLDALAARIKFILDEQARRHGIDV